MNQTNFSDDEFDVELLAQKVSRVAKKFLSKLFFPIRVITHKPIRLISFMLAGILVAVTLRYTIPPTYQSAFIFKPANQGDLYFIHLLQDVGNLVHDRDYVAVSEQLKLDENRSSKIVNISLDPIRKNGNNDSIAAVMVYITTKDNTLFDTIQNSLMNYIETNEYYEKTKKLRVQDIEDMRVKLTADISEIESLKKNLTQNAQPRNAGGFVYGEPVNPVMVYEEALALYKQQMGLKWQDAFVENFELVKKCVPTKKIHSPKLISILPITLAISILLCFFYNYRKL